MEDKSMNKNKDIQIPEDFLLDINGKLWLPGNVFFADAWRLAKKLRADFKNYPHIYCLARGGYSFGSVVGNCFERNDIPSLMVKSYAGEESGELTINSEIPLELLQSGGKDMLILDDLFDTGKTVRRLKEILPNAIFAAVYAKPQGEVVADFFLRRVPDIWIVFPWEGDMRDFVSAS